MAERYLRPELHASKLSDLWISSSLANTIWGTALLATLAIFALSDWDVQDYTLSVIQIVTLLVVYVSFIPAMNESIRFLPFVNIEADIFVLSLRTVIMLIVVFGFQTVIFGLPNNGVAPVIPLGLAKALSWFFTIKTVHYPVLTPSPQSRHASWCIAATIATFSIVSNIDISMQPSELKAVSQVIASCLALGQIIYLLPKQAKARHLLWVLTFFCLVPYRTNLLAIQNSVLSAPTRSGSIWEHPVEALVRNAEADFEQRMKSQSKDYTAAHNKYQQRYHVEPPPGFKAWYDFAVANQSPIIDEFDMIYEMISPFWRLSGKEVTQIMIEAQNTRDLDLWTCTFFSDTAKTSCTHPRRSFDRHIELLFNDLLGRHLGILPDFKFLVNHLDEPRVIIPPHSQSGSSPNARKSFTTTDLAKRSSWDAITKFCTSQQSTSRKFTGYPVKTYTLPFITDRSADIDLCQHPEYATMHGLFMSPTSLNLIEGLLPILSTGSPSPMGDLLFPSPAYMEPGFRYNEEGDIPWNKKRNKLYWAGSTTGGFAADDKWHSYHRQRFVAKAQNLERNNHYLRKKEGVVIKEQSNFLDGRLYDVFFTRIFQCCRKSCRDQRAYFNYKSWVNAEEAFNSKLVFDIDGNGISGRFYKLLASRSTPLKQTLFREWHDERLVPWVHYIPISVSMEEVPEIVFFLTSTKRGSEIAEVIAGRGKEWFGKAFRDVDLSVYVFRLLLEVARLQDLEREAISVDVPDK